MPVSDQPECVVKRKTTLVTELCNKQEQKMINYSNGHRNVLKTTVSVEN